MTEVARVPYTRREHGLFTAAQVVRRDDDDWVAFDLEWVEWCDSLLRDWPLWCRPGDDSPGDSPGDEEKVATEASGFGRSIPGTLYYMPECRIGPGRENPRNVAREVFDAREQTAVERRFWLDTLVDCDELLDSDDVRCAFGAVEQHLSWRYPGVGVIHVPQWAEGYLTDIGVLVWSGASARTVTGTPVVLGSGYFGVPGTGAAEAGFTIVGTGAVRVDLGPLRNPEPSTPDYLRNIAFGLAEKNVAVGYACVCVSATVTGCTVPALPGYQD